MQINAKSKELLERLNKFSDYIKNNNIKSKKTENDIYYQDKLLAERGWYVLDVPPAILYRANCLFDELVAFGSEGASGEFLKIISDTLSE